MTQRDRLEVAADVFARWNLQPRTRENHRENATLNRLTVDLVLDQLAAHQRSLRMTDQSDAAALIVMRKVVAPRVFHVVVSQRSIDVDRMAVQAGAQRRQRHLAIQRCIGPAYRRKAREL